MSESTQYEKLDLFYLGRELDPQTAVTTHQPLLYRHKHLTTHAAIIGMTGSGKTGLGMDLLEEAAMDRIPAIIIDPKGDMGNLLLSFPDLSAADFQPWVDPAKAERSGLSVGQLAGQISENWQKGLHAWGQDGERIRRMRASADWAIYTPGSSSGRPVSILAALSSPDPQLMDDNEAVANLVNSTVSSLLGLLGIPADPLKSREHILLSAAVLNAWRAGKDLNLPALINAVVQPDFDKVGVFPLESFYPRSKRLELAMQLNAIIASPVFSGWLEGEPLAIERILYTAKGKPRLSIFSIAHLGDPERMFFVTMLLGKLIAWMRRQEGSSGLRCLLYMDEIFGYFPPNGNPPSKKPMLLLLRQARAFGVGIILATQNPVDLDYKGLANMGTWFIGRLQTRQDQDRVLAGIGAPSDPQTSTNLRQWLGDMRSRTFLMHSAHRAEPVRFEARWAMSYLKGPMTLAEIARLTTEVDNGPATDPVSDPISEGTGHAGSRFFTETLPILSGAVEQRFVMSPVPLEKLYMVPYLAGSAVVRFFDQKRGIDQCEEVVLRQLLSEGFHGADWHRAEPFAANPADLLASAPQTALYADVPSQLASLGDFRDLEKSLADYLYRQHKLRLHRVKSLKLESRPGETTNRFHQRIADALRESKENKTARIEERYSTKLRQAHERLEKALNRIEKEQQDVKARGMDTALSLGVAVMGALFGRKALSVSTSRRTANSMRSAGKILKEKEDVARAQDAVKREQENIQRLSDELAAKLNKIADAYDASNYPVEEFFISPRRSDISRLKVFLLWEPQIDFSGVSFGESF